MFQVSVINNKTSQTYGAMFSSSTDAQNWINQCVASNVWGKPQRVIIPDSQGQLIDWDGTVLQAANALSSTVVTLVPAVAAVAASYDGIPAGATTSITITAQTAGSTGNVALSLDGKSTLTQIISAWNTANSSNQLTLSGDGSQVPSIGSVSLAGGANEVPAVTQTNYTFSADYTITGPTDITSNQTLNPDWLTLIAKRDQLLSLCDWMMLSDCPYSTDQAAWVTYRQNLRELPNNNTSVDPTTIAWPTPPTAPLIKGINS